MDIRQATAPRPAPVPEAPFDAPSPARAERPTTCKTPEPAQESAPLAAPKRKPRKPRKPRSTSTHPPSQCGRRGDGPGCGLMLAPRWCTGRRRPCRHVRRERGRVRASPAAQGDRRATGDVRTVPIRCGSTRESVCPPCATKARRVRMQQYREGWHLTEDPPLPERGLGQESGGHEYGEDPGEVDSPRSVVSGQLADDRTPPTCPGSRWRTGPRGRRSPPRTAPATGRRCSTPGPCRPTARSSRAPVSRPTRPGTTTGAPPWTRCTSQAGRPALAEPAPLRRVQGPVLLRRRGTAPARPAPARRHPRRDPAEDDPAGHQGHLLPTVVARLRRGPLRHRPPSGVGPGGWRVVLRPRHRSPAAHVPGRPRRARRRLRRHTRACRAVRAADRRQGLAGSLSERKVPHRDGATGPRSGELRTSRPASTRRCTSTTSGTRATTWRLRRARAPAS